MKWQIGRSVMRKLQPVSFNLTDEEEKELYEHAMKEKYFSRYIKKLITQDINGVVMKVVEESIQVAETPKRVTKVVKPMNDVTAFF